MRSMGHFLIIFAIFILILIWHPWATLHDDVEESIKMQLGTQYIIFEKSWIPTGERVVFHNETVTLGYCDVGYWGTPDIIKTYLGDISPYGIFPIEKPVCDDYDYRMGDTFYYTQEITPTRMIFQYGLEVIYDPTVLQPINITNGTIFQDFNTTPFIKQETGRIHYNTTSLNSTIEPGSLISIKFEVIGNKNTYVLMENI